MPYKLVFADYCPEGIEVAILAKCPAKGCPKFVTISVCARPDEMVRFSDIGVNCPCCGHYFYPQAPTMRAIDFVAQRLRELWHGREMQKLRNLPYIGIEKDIRDCWKEELNKYIPKAGRGGKKGRFKSPKGYKMAPVGEWVNDGAETVKR